MQMLHMECLSCSIVVLDRGLGPSNTQHPAEEEGLYGHFVTTLNDSFEQAHASEDFGYKSGSESMNIPTPLHQAP